MRLDVTSDINRDHVHLMGYDRVDRFLVRTLWAHFVVVLLLALTNAVLQWSLTTPSPFGWRAIGRLEAAAAILIGLGAASIPALSRRWVRTHYDWRIGVTGALTTYSCLLVFLSGGAIEMHFHFFERLGYRVTGLTSSLATFEVFRRAAERFDVVVTDLTMPKLTGTELASELRRIRPDVPIVLTSGHSVHEDRERARGLGIAELVAKPNTVHALGTAIQRALAQI